MIGESELFYDLPDASSTAENLIGNLSSKLHPRVSESHGWIIFTHIIGSIIVACLMVISVAVQMGSYFSTRTYLVMKFTMAQLFFLGILFDTRFNLETEE